MTKERKMTANHGLAGMILLIGFTLATPGVAQDLAPPLPAICLAEAGHTMAPMAEGHQMGARDAAHEDLANGMAETNAQMMQGMTAADIDVAFVCGMIPHHQAAINMARAELTHGDDPWARELAQNVIDAQQKEIDDMLKWLEQQGS
jgi:uncharacterized protein (DUF305 family)